MFPLISSQQPLHICIIKVIFIFIYFQYQLGIDDVKCQEEEVEEEEELSRTVLKKREVYHDNNKLKVMMIKQLPIAK